jgi:2-polyprenyl-3-methyl-5-hydroxy-6-metoxy-1,4-benzoquinol methylase
MEKTTWKWKLAQKLEYKWWQRYLKKTGTEEYHQWKIKYWKDLLAVLSVYVPVTENSSIMDAGCGPAGIFMALEGNKVDAIDPLLDKYKSLPHFQPEKFAWTTFRNMPIELLDETEKYDMIFCMNAINHVNDIGLCCDNLLHSLKPNGYLVISTDAHKHSVLKKLFQLLPGDMLHPVQLDIAEYETLFTRGKADIVQQILYKEGNIFDYYITIAKKKS